METKCGFPGCPESCSSNDLCPRHDLERFTETVRVIQEFVEKNWGCFRKAVGGSCDQPHCYWRRACLVSNPGLEEMAILSAHQSGPAEEMVKILAESPLFCILPHEELRLMVERGGRSFFHKDRLTSLLQNVRPDCDDQSIQRKCLEIAGHT